jgi:membrane dipeptidase
MSVEGLFPMWEGIEMTNKINSFSRRRVLQISAAASAASLMGTSLRAKARTETIAGISPTTSRIVRDALIIDMLAPLKIDFRPQYFAARLSDTDAADIRRSGITAMHNSAGLQTKEDALEYLAAWQGFVGRNTHVFSLVSELEDIARAKREGKCAVIMGIQNAEHFTTADDVDRFYRLGQRCSQLTYNAQNLLGSGCTERVDGGVSDFGVEIIERMNKVGMLIDVSHCGERTTLDAITIAKGPITITHSNCKALNNHPRLKTDEAIRALAAKGGVIGITGVRNFVSASEPTNIRNLVDHIDHVVKLVGIEYVGVGSDADLNGYDDMPKDQYKDLKSGYKGSYGFRDKLDTDGFDSPLKYFMLAEELLRRGYSRENIFLILGGNFQRLLGSVWKMVPPAS